MSDREAREYSYGAFVFEPIPESSLHRLGDSRAVVAAWARQQGRAVYWTYDRRRDFFVVELPCPDRQDGDCQPVPVFLFGYRDDAFTCEFLEFSEQHEKKEERFVHAVTYRRGLLRLPAHLRMESEAIQGRIYDSLRAYREAKMEWENAERAVKDTGAIEAFTVEIEDIRFVD